MVGDEAGPSGTGEGATVIPTDDEVRAFAAEYRDLARGCEAGIPEGWWRDWLAWMLRDLKRRPWPADWQRIMVNRFTSDLVSRHPKALGLSGEPGEARGAGGISKKIAAGSMARPDGRTVAQARFQLDRELAQVRERLDAAHEVNLPPDAADKRRERELRAAIAELEAQ